MALRPLDETVLPSLDRLSWARWIPDVTVVVPTRNEASNVEELLRQLDGSLNSLSAEVLFVDDSEDSTADVIRAAAKRYCRPIRVLHREGAARRGGLAGAVVDGFGLARAPWVVVIDADLQHPPGVIPELLAKGVSAEADLVAATRYQDQGEAGGLSGRWRMWVSAMCTMLAKIVFPVRLRGISDPMSGFFAVRLAALDVPSLRPTGYKVLLEVLVRSRFTRVAQVPYTFGPRFSGASKTASIEGFRYLQHLCRLRFGGMGSRLHQVSGFLAVGASGVVVNTVALWLLTGSGPRLPYPVASVLATHLAIAWNFLLLETIVFRQVRALPALQGLLRFWLVNVALLPVHLLLLVALVEGLHVPPVGANVAALAAVFGLRYLATVGWVYGWRATAADVVATPPKALMRAATGRLVMNALATRPAARLILLPAATVLAFPNAVFAVVKNVSPFGAYVALTLLACVVFMIDIVVTIARLLTQLRAEPDVHDRQLDVIASLPLLFASAWLSIGEPSSVPITSRELVAVTAFLAGSSFLLLGTRMVMRFRWVLCLPLLAIPVTTGKVWHFGLLALALALAVVVAGPSSRTVPALRSTLVAVPLPTHYRPPPRLPQLLPAGVIVLSLAIGLGACTVATDPSLSLLP